MYYYKAVKNDTGEVIGLASGETPWTEEEKNDTLHNVTYVEIDEAEYLALCEQLGISPR